MPDIDVCKIYTAGKMHGLTLDEQMDWRNEVEGAVREAFETFWAPRKYFFVHPPLFYSYETTEQQSEKEIKDWELAQLRDCDIVVVNLDGLQSSVGTLYELATVDAVNSSGGKHIFVIGIGGDDIQLHPWVADTLHRREKTCEDAAKYIVQYLLM